MPPRQKATKAKVIEIVALTGKPVRFAYTGDALDGNKVDIEYTEVVCKHLLACTECTDSTSALTPAHFTTCIPGRAAMLEEPTADPEDRVRYTEHDNKSYIRAALTDGKWRLELPAEMIQAREP